MKKYLFIFFLSFISLQGFTNHIVGGEIYYDFLGGNSYRITLKIYRDCFGGGAPYDDLAKVGVFYSSGQLYDILDLKFPGSKAIGYDLNNPCIRPPNNICVEQAIYSTTINLPPIKGGYTLTYQRCCRNSSISNIISPDVVGSTYSCHIPGSELATQNSSPHFTYFPPIYVCLKEPLSFDHSATDPDGDSLSYEFTDPLLGADISSPMADPIPPPYQSIIWNSPYNTNYQLASSPQLSIDCKTGLLIGTPSQLGQFVVGIKVKEYRKGVLLGETHRDFQFNVMGCPKATIAAIPAQTTQCFGVKVDFQNNSINGIKWHWNFGDPSTTQDTSSQRLPAWTYPGPGTYTVMLIANPGYKCADTAYTSFHLEPLLQPYFVTGKPQCLPGNSFDFTAGGAFQGIGTFKWDFGKAAVPVFSNQKDISHVTFIKPGVHPVTLTISENGCTISYIDKVTVLEAPILNYTAPPVIGCAPFYASFSDSLLKSPSINNLVWDFGDGTISTLESPTHLYTKAGVYTVHVTLNTDNFCIKNRSFTVKNMITIHPKPTTQLEATPRLITVANNTVLLSSLVEGAIKCKIYFGDGDSINDCHSWHSYPADGTYIVTLITENAYGCKDTAKISIESDAQFWIPNTFTPNYDGKNDMFLPVVERVNYFHMAIYNRWGNRIFESYNPKVGWDGTYKGMRCQEDVYTWKIEFTNAGEQSSEKDYVGRVQLIK